MIKTNYTLNNLNETDIIKFLQYINDKNNLNINNKSDLNINNKSDLNTNSKSDLNINSKSATSKTKAKNGKSNDKGNKKKIGHSLFNIKDIMKIIKEYSYYTPNREIPFKNYYEKYISNSVINGTFDFKTEELPKLLRPESKYIGRLGVIIENCIMGPYFLIVWIHPNGWLFGVIFLECKHSLLSQANKEKEERILYFDRYSDPHNCLRNINSSTVKNKNIESKELDAEMPRELNAGPRGLAIFPVYLMESSYNYKYIKKLYNSNVRLYSLNEQDNQARLEFKKMKSIDLTEYDDEYQLPRIYYLLPWTRYEEIDSKWRAKNTLTFEQVKRLLHFL